MVMNGFDSNMQHSLRSFVSCEGVALHSGNTVNMRICPAPANSGIVFIRTDIDNGASERAYVHVTYDSVTDTQLGTKIENEYGIRVSTIEHLMAAFWGLGVDNAFIEIDSDEVPIVDGSSAPHVSLLEKAGIVSQNVPRKYIVIDRPIEVIDGDSVAKIYPHDGFKLDVEIDFEHDAISHQRAVYDFSVVSFKNMLSEARTFGFSHEVDYLRSIGLARGGSLDNAIVIGKEGVLNDEGLRFDDEFIRHKALDCVGDYFLAGMRMKAKIVTSRPGHGINNRLLHAIFENQDAWHVQENSNFKNIKNDVLVCHTHRNFASGISMPQKALLKNQD